MITPETIKALAEDVAVADNAVAEAAAAVNRARDAMAYALSNRAIAQAQYVAALQEVEAAKRRTRDPKTETA